MPYFFYVTCNSGSRLHFKTQKDLWPARESHTIHSQSIKADVELTYTSSEAHIPDFDNIIRPLTSIITW